MSEDEKSRNRLIWNADVAARQQEKADRHFMDAEAMLGRVADRLNDGVVELAPDHHELLARALREEPRVALPEAPGALEDGETKENS